MFAWFERWIAWPAGRRNALLWILLVGLLIRVALIVATPHFKPANDPADYDRIAVSIADGHGYPDTNYAAPGTPAGWRTPGYPGLLGAVYAVTGHSLFAGRLMGALL